MCYDKHALDTQPSGTASGTQSAPPTRSSEPILIAVPAVDDKRIEVYQFPDERLAAVVPRVEPTETGKLASERGSGFRNV